MKLTKKNKKSRKRCLNKEAQNELALIQTWKIKDENSAEALIAQILRDAEIIARWSKRPFYIT